MVDFPNKTNPLISRVKISKPDFGNEMAMERERFPKCEGPPLGGFVSRWHHDPRVCESLNQRSITPSQSPLHICCTAGVEDDEVLSSRNCSRGMGPIVIDHILWHVCVLSLEDGGTERLDLNPSRQSEETIITYNNQRSRTFMKEVTKKVPSGYLT